MQYLADCAIILKKESKTMISQNSSYRVIFHIDLNCFFASCAIAKNPQLKGKPVIIAKNTPLHNGIVLTASYEARKYGIKAAMLAGDAIKLCPQVIIVEPDYQLYAHCSRLFFDYLGTITKNIEPMSIDEGFLDVTSIVKGKDAIKLASSIMDYLLKTYDLPCSIGIAPNKFLAKMASDMKKPLGITVLRKREVPLLLWPLPIQDMFGVGKMTARKLIDLGIKTIGDLALYPRQDEFKKIFGTKRADYLIKRSQGIDDVPVMSTMHEMQSFSNSYTFSFPEANQKTITATYKVLLNTMLYRMEKEGYLALTYGIQLRYPASSIVTRSRSLGRPSLDNNVICPLVMDLFRNLYHENMPVRLIGVFASRLVKKEKQNYNLFSDLDKIEKDGQIRSLLKKINADYQNEVIHIGLKKE